MTNTISKEGDKLALLAAKEALRGTLVTTGALLGIVLLAALPAALVLVPILLAVEVAWAYSLLLLATAPSAVFMVAFAVTYLQLRDEQSLEDPGTETELTP